MLNIIINKEKLKALPLQLGSKQMFPFSDLTQHNALSLSYRKRKRKGTQAGKEEVKLSLLWDDINLCLKD